MQLIFKEKIFSISRRSYSIQDEVGNAIYSIAGKIISLDNRFSIKDMTGREIAFIKRKSNWWRLLNLDYEIYRDNKICAVVKWPSPRFTTFSNSFIIEIPDSCNIFVELSKGTYRFIRDGKEIAVVNPKRLNFIRANYSLNIKENNDSLLMVAAWMAIYILLNHDQCSLIYRPGC